MKISQRLFESQRQYKRKKTLNAVRWDHREGENVDGKIHDISPAGIFLAPLGKMPKDIHPEDPIWLVLRINNKDYFLSATVRWRGVSKEHGEFGFGLEFADNSKRLAEDLCLKMAESGLFFVPA
ncbi:MAG: PilZ domain-containing protein [Nitrospiria bacterium]